MADDIAAPEVKLTKRPIAFLVRSPAGMPCFYIDEEIARRVADAWDVEYQGLYVRDGT